MFEQMCSDMLLPGLPVLEKMLRPVLVYFFLLIGLRLAGKRELAQLNAMDLVVLLTISNTVQNAIIGNDNSVSGGLIGATTLLAINYFVVRFLYNHEKISHIIEGDADKLIENGAVRMDRLKKELLTVNELEIAAHKQGFSSLEEVETAILDPGGVISFVGKKPSPDEQRFADISVHIREINQKLDDLKAAVSTRS
jgi:uncharacterized membrane protein YcaP (DUF421 family)